jgi:hypothetical protein
MKYYKSKRGYFYKMVGDKKTRISIEEYKSMKGGHIESNGILEENDFLQKITIPRHFPRKKINNEIELQSIEEVKDNSSIPEPKIMREAGLLSNEPYIFFGYNPKTGKYRYVFYNDTRFEFLYPKLAINTYRSYKKSVICKELNNDGGINELSHEKIRQIPINDLAKLFLFLLKKREHEPDFMNRLFTYLWFVIYQIITIPVSPNGVVFGSGPKLKLVLPLLLEILMLRLTVTKILMLLMRMRMLGVSQHCD